MAKSDPILLAEDDADFVELVRQALKRASLPNPLVVARNGQEAIACLEGSPAHSEEERRRLFGLLMLDLRMPVLDGFDVLAWLRARPCLRDLPVVTLSSVMAEEDSRKARQLGAVDCRTKPDPERLSELLQELHGKWMADQPTG